MSIKIIDKEQFEGVIEEVVSRELKKLFTNELRENIVKTVTPVVENAVIDIFQSPQFRKMILDSFNVISNNLKTDLNKTYEENIDSYVVLIESVLRANQDKIVNTLRSASGGKREFNEDDFTKLSDYLRELDLINEIEKNRGTFKTALINCLKTYSVDEIKDAIEYFYRSNWFNEKFNYRIFFSDKGITGWISKAKSELYDDNGNKRFAMIIGKDTLKEKKFKTINMSDLECDKLVQEYSNNLKTLDNLLQLIEEKNQELITNKYNPYGNGFGLKVISSYLEKNGGK